MQLCRADSHQTAAQRPLQAFKNTAQKLWQQRMETMLQTLVVASHAFLPSRLPKDSSTEAATLNAGPFREHTCAGHQDK
jgi:hypothetical protein